MLKQGLAALAAAAVMCGAGSAIAKEGAEETDGEGVDKRLGPEVSSICFGRSINGWKTVDKEDDVVLLEKGVNRWYRVELRGACDYRTLRFALTIGIESRPAGGCVREGDIILVEDSSGFARRCFISRINEWDDDAPAPGEEEREDTDGGDS